MADDLEQLVEPRANWHYFITGSACVVQLKIGEQIPRIPGKISKDMEVVGMIGKYEKYLSTFLKKLYPDGSYKSKNYKSLPKKNSVIQKLAYTFCGAYNSSYGNYLEPLKYQLELKTNNSDCYEYYVGSNVYFICRASHRGSGYDKDTGTINITITHTDGSVTSKTLKNIYQSRTDLLGDTPSDMVYLTERLDKPIRKIQVIADYPAAGAQWHDTNDRQWYYDWIIKNGANTFKNNLVGDLHLENLINFKAVSGYSTQVVEDEKLEIV